MNCVGNSSAIVLNNKKNHTITILRVLAMLMIIGCHLSSWLDINFVAMILNVGVFIFLLISGMLYSNKKIEQGMIFIGKRWIKLCVPMYYLVGFLLIYYFLRFGFEVVWYIPTYLFNFQGIRFLTKSIYIYQLNEFRHLWFLTVIMICYVILLVVKKIENDAFWNKMNRICFVFFFMFILDVAAKYTMGLQLHYFIAFMVGYAIGKKETRISIRKYSVIALVMMCAMGVRIVARRHCDDTILYNNLVVPFTTVILAVWIYVTIQFLFQKKSNFMRMIATNHLTCYLEQLSIYLYMTHHVFLVGPFNIGNLPTHKAIQIFIFIILTVLSAMLLQVISERTICKIKRRMDE